MAKIKYDDLKRDVPNYPNQILKFETRIPPSNNHMYIYGKGRGMKALTAQARSFVKDTQRIVSLAIKKQGWKKDKDHVWYYMDLYFYFPDRIKRDSHNCIKILTDTLEGIVYNNDYFIMPRIQFVGYDKENPRCEIKIYAQ